MPNIIDFTPRGLLTEEGNQRNRKAIDELGHANANLLNALVECLTTSSSMEDSLRRIGVEPDGIQDVMQMVETRKAATEEFLRSLTGAPPWKST